ncbi:class I SAM-dependent methyltransferase [Roseateles oligotrophus]|uniref:S-adenosyl-L-methionine-dependent methyltransferase n=1 Tax=Roseateles oligotrophus TaxID=1769250 RepID=A0ABT2YB28_9BURK|nr:SAM-dependent methyltransferase [Roseateles oligotrophus]MCV2367488.1 SAM-dependent methyltransferase [Roseateles oligotrophus]
MRAQRASSTALVIAAAQVLARNDRRSAALVSEQAERYCRACLRAASSPWRRLESQVGRASVRWLLKLVERLTLPGIVDHYLYRKRLLRRWADAAVGCGCQQLVVLGAGFDTLALELAHLHPALRCIEIDHPATQAVKLRALRRLGESTALACAGSDLAHQQLAAALAAAGFEARRSTLFVAEGLSMYLPLERVLALLDLLRASCPQASIAFSFMEPDAKGRARFAGARPWLQAWLGLVGEPFRWSASRLEVAACLAQRAVTVQQVVANSDLLREHAPLMRSDSCEGEVYVLGRWGDWPGPITTPEQPSTGAPQRQIDTPSAQ